MPLDHHRTTAPASTAARPPLSVVRWWPLAVRAPVALVVAALGMRLFDEWMSYLPSGAFEAFREDLGLSYGAAAGILTAIGVGGLAGSAFTVLADTRSRRAIAAFGAYGYAASIATFGLGRAPWVLVLAAIGIGICATALVDALEVALVDVAGDRLELLLARINVGATLGDLLGPVVLAGVIAAGGSWRTALVASAVLMAGFATVVALAPIPAPGASPHPDDVRARDTGAGDTGAGDTGAGDTGAEDADAEDDDPALPRGRAALLAVLRTPAVWWAGLLGAGLVALDESYLGFLVAGFEEERGASRAASVVLGSAGVVGAAVASLWLARRTPVAPPVRRMAVAAGVMAATATSFAVAPTTWLPVVAIVAFDAALIAFWLPLQAIALRLVPGRAGTTKAVIGAIEMLGLLVPVGVGALADAVDLRAGLLAYAAVPALMLALTLTRRSQPNVRHDGPMVVTS